MLFTRLALLFPLEMQDVFVELIGEAEHTPYETQQQTNQILLQFLMPFTRETNTTLVSLVKNDVFIDDWVRFAHSLLDLKNFFKCSLDLN